MWKTLLRFCEPLKWVHVSSDKGKGKAKEVKEVKSGPEFGFQELVEEL